MNTITMNDELMMKDAGAAIRAAQADMKAFFPRKAAAEVKAAPVVAEITLRATLKKLVTEKLEALPFMMPVWITAVVRSSQDIYLFGRTNLIGNYKVVRGMVNSGRYPLWKIGESLEMVEDLREELQLIGRDC